MTSLWGRRRRIYFKLPNFEKKYSPSNKNFGQTLEKSCVIQDEENVKKNHKCERGIERYLQHKNHLGTDFDFTCQIRRRDKGAKRHPQLRAFGRFFRRKKRTPNFLNTQTASQSDGTVPWTRASIPVSFTWQRFYFNAVLSTWNEQLITLEKFLNHLLNPILF